jgi:hypothetical protein
MANTPGSKKDDKDGKDKKDPFMEPVYTIDVDRSKIQEMPSITSLLNRKRLETRGKAEKLSESTNSIRLHVGKKAIPKIQSVASRKSSSATRRLRDWTVADLASGQDSIRKGLALLVQKIPFQALIFLPRQSKESTQGGAAMPFQAVASYGAGDLMGLWSGLSFSGEIIQDIWQEVLEAGYIEVAPSVVADSEATSRRFFRSFLGLPASCWFTVICYGRPGECSGIVVLSSAKSCAQFVVAAFPYLKAFNPLKKAKAA